MKTTTEKTQELLDELIYFDLKSLDGISKAKQSIKLALKCQARDVRHLCAEAVIPCGGNAHDICMNVNTL